MPATTGKLAAFPGKRLALMFCFDDSPCLDIDCNPQSGREIRDVHPFLVLSPHVFNDRTSLVIGLPMTTAEYNADNLFAIAVGRGQGRKADKTSYVLCHQPKSFDWRQRDGRPHALGVLSNNLFAQVCERLNQIIQLMSGQ